jgi:hypothetical protein
MQTFLPYPDFEKSLRCLDKKRLFKQAVETSQILTIIDPELYEFFPHRSRKKFKNRISHPAVLMWVGPKKDRFMFLDSLIQYYNLNIKIAKEMGIRVSSKLPIITKKYHRIACLPPWFGFKNFHKTHKSNLLRKLYPYYIKYEGFKNIPSNLDYFWIRNNLALMKEIYRRFEKSRIQYFKRKEV